MLNSQIQILTHTFDLTVKVFQSAMKLHKFIPKVSSKTTGHQVGFHQNHCSVYTVSLNQFHRHFHGQPFSSHGRPQPQPHTPANKP